MNRSLLKNPRLDKKGVEIEYPISEDELQSQVHEIFIDEYYKPRKEKNNVCVDLGANVGIATLYLRSFAKKTYSIEPSPQLYEALALNTKKYADVKTFNYAIYTINGTIPLAGFDGEIPQTTHPDLHRADKTKDISRIEVPSKTLETFMEENDIKKIDILKMDIEGSEYEVCMDEAFERVSDKIACIVGETHYVGESCYPEMFKYILEERGFKFKFLKGKREHNMWKDIVYLKNNAIAKSLQVPLWTNFIAWRN